MEIELKLNVFEDFSEYVSSENSIYDSESETTTSTNSEQFVDCCLSPFESSLMVCVLGDKISELKIVGYTYNNTNTKSDPLYDFLKQKLLKDVRKVLHNPLTMELYTEAMSVMKVVKIQKERDFIQDVLKSTKIGIKSKSTFKDLRRTILSVLKLRERDSLIKLEQLENAETLKKLQESVIQETEQRKSKIKEMDAAISELENQIQDSQLIADLKQKLVEKWEKSRKEQQIYQMEQQIVKLECEIKTFSIKIDRELRITAEKESYLNKTILKYSNAIEDWEKRYNMEVTKYENNITYANDRNLKKTEEYNKLLSLYHAHKDESEAFILVKKKRQAEADRLKQLTDAAIKIQSWWRGTIVRKGFGKGKKGKKGKAGRATDSKDAKKAKTAKKK